MAPEMPVKMGDGDVKESAPTMDTTIPEKAPKEEAPMGVKGESGTGATSKSMGAPPAQFNPGFPLERREMKEWAKRLGIARRDLERCMGVQRAKR